MNSFDLLAGSYVFCLSVVDIVDVIVVVVIVAVVVVVNELSVENQNQLCDESYLGKTATAPPTILNENLKVYLVRPGRIADGFKACCNQLATFLKISWALTWL